MDNRWYDQHAILSERLDDFKEMDEKRKDYLIKGVMNLVTGYDPNLLSCDKAFDFPLAFNRQRWYDQDPYLWLMFNTLKIADAKLIQSVTHYLENENKKEHQ
jgi:predicted PolB exonuclease-like 3'-5' exonuclease